MVHFNPEDPGITALIVLQIAVSIPLIVGATLFVRTLNNLSDVELGFSVSSGRLLKDISPGSPAAVADVPPGASVSQTFDARGDKEGSGSISVSASSAGTTLDTATLPLTVIK